MAEAEMISGLAPMLGVFAGMIFIAVIVGIAIYIYTAFAWMTIAKKLGYDKGWLA